MASRAQFSRSNQPVKCRMCGKNTTWSEANNYGGLGLCKACFEAATIENEHYDGYHDEKPSAKCKLCQEAR